ncbi:CLUMA_CG004171, isoform A, partial [Clunio marinus]
KQQPVAPRKGLTKYALKSRLALFTEETTSNVEVGLIGVLLLPLNQPPSIHQKPHISRTMENGTPPQLPMPDKDVLQRSFNQLLGSLDLPDDKIKEMNSYDDHKKWEILCSRSLMKIHQSPSFYLQRLKRSIRVKMTQSKTDVTDILRGLEVSLRTYSIEYLKSFSDERNSLSKLVDFMTSSNLSSENFLIIIQSFKVIMNDANGFGKAINHQILTDNLVRYLPTLSIKNRCNILQLMVMACEKSQKGLDRVLKALKANGRFEILMDFLTLNKENEIEQMVIVATLNLIKLIISLPIDLNYRIGLDKKLRVLTFNESNLTAEVIDEIKSFKSMIIDVNQLAKDRVEIKVKAKAELMDGEKQSINLEVSKEYGRMELSKDSDVDQRPEILQKSSTPKRETEKEVKNTEKTALRPNQVHGTVFYGLNDERLRKIINFTHFEDKFHIIDKSQSPENSSFANRIRSPIFVTLLESTRLRNVSIVLRKLNFDADVAIEAINDYNFNQLNLDSIELLTNLAPKDLEIEAYRSYMKMKKNIAVLSEEDKFLMKLSQVERLKTKLTLMNFIGNFPDQMNLLAIHAVSSASLSLKSSKKFKGILEIILTVCNYMNGNKSTATVYGFPLKGTLERLNDIQSNDKNLSLLENIVNLFKKNITEEFVSIENNWNMFIEERKFSKSFTLKTFEVVSSEKFNKLINEHKMTMNNYNDCICYFGEENENSIDSDEFFSIKKDKVLDTFTVCKGDKVCLLLENFRMIISGTMKGWLVKGFTKPSYFFNELREKLKGDLGKSRTTKRNQLNPFTNKHLLSKMQQRCLFVHSLMDIY